MRLIRPAAFAALSLVVCGCVEGEAVYTLNPDGSGKVDVDLTCPPTIGVLGGHADDPDATLRSLVAHALSASRNEGITAWSNVRGEFTKDGRFRFRGTAYFKTLDEVKVDAPGQFEVVKGADGSLTVKEKKEDRPRKKKPRPDFAKLTDAEWARFLLSERIEGQAAKPLLVSFCADMNLKVTIRMPGEITEAKGFKVVDKNGALLEIHGDALIKEVNRILALSDTDLRKLYLEGKGPGFGQDESFGTFLFGGPVSATTAKPSVPAFDYEKEVKAAVAGNAELRKKYQIPEFERLPGDPAGKTPGLPKLPLPPPPPPKPKD